MEKAEGRMKNQCLALSKSPVSTGADPPPLTRWAQAAAPAHDRWSPPCTAAASLQAGQERASHMVQGSPCQMCCATRKAQQMGQSICFAQQLHCSAREPFRLPPWDCREVWAALVIVHLESPAPEPAQIFPFTFSLDSSPAQTERRIREKKNTIGRALRLWKKQHHSQGT